MNQDAQMRNIQDRYANWEIDAIVSDLNAKRHNFSVLAVNTELDLNTCGLARTFDGMLGQEFYIYGNKHWNKRGSVGAQHYHRIKYINDIDQVPWEDYYVVGLDNVEGAQFLEPYEWHFDKHVLICVGQEKGGIPPEIAAKCQDMIIIEQFGAIRCLNVNVATGMMLYDYVSKLHKKEAR